MGAAQTAAREGAESHAVMRQAISTTPTLGAPSSSLFNLQFTPPPQHSALSTQPLDAETVVVELETLSGGRLSGPVADHNEHGVVIVAGRKPYVFAWDELDPGSVYRARKALLILARGGEAALTAEDHFNLGRDMLRRGRNVVAINEFNLARRLDAAYAVRIDAALDEHRKTNQAAGNGQSSKPEELIPLDAEGEASDITAELAGALTVDGDVGHRPAAGATKSSSAVEPPAKAPRADVVEKIKAFFNVRLPTAVGPDVELVETEHFLIWSDLPPAQRDRLPAWCESLYAALCGQFGFDPAAHVFPGKCPVFCFRSKGRFLNFARRFDGNTDKSSIGYTRSIADRAYSHVALYAQGQTEADLNRFASTLVHEASHAFLHQFHSHRLIPHWVNEGIAEMMAERVLGDRCPAGENAALLARPYVRYGWPVSAMLSQAGPIEVHQYPLAASLAMFMASTDRAAFAAFVCRLKEGADIQQALVDAYGGLTPAGLELRWRAWVRGREGPAAASGEPADSDSKRRP